MIFNKKLAIEQVDNLLCKYQNLKIKSISDIEIVLEGYILVNCFAKDFTLYKKYNLKIVIPLFSEELPYVIDTGKHIDSHYPHKYRNSKLCLETDTNIRIRFAQGFLLSEWMTEYVELYYFSYEYYKRYGFYPFGERAHGSEGILQTYCELFKEENYKKTYMLMESICKEKYRGHRLCPCGSGKKLRLCHGPIVFNYYTDKYYNSIIQKDFKYIEESIKNENRRTN